MKEATDGCEIRQVVSPDWAVRPWHGSLRFSGILNVLLQLRLPLPVYQGDLLNY